jgi:hypothetical protein
MASRQPQSNCGACLTAFTPSTQEQQSAVREQLERILAHPSFKNSERCKNYLRYITEYSLRNEAPPLKERTVGIEAFGRPADYDTSHDSVVRNTASETRSRLAQYYEDNGAEDKIQIKTPPGSYHVEFYILGESPAATVEPIEPPTRGTSWVRRKIWAISIVAAISIAAVTGLGLWQQENLKQLILDLLRNNYNRDVKTSSSWRSLELFWKPVLDSPSSVLLCIGEFGEFGEPQQSRGELNAESSSSHVPSVSLSTASAIANLSSILGSSQRRPLLKTANTATFEDFRDDDAILIGGLDNLWTLRLTENMRFRFVRAQPPEPARIEDAKNKQSKGWTFGPSRDSNTVQDYAIVARYLDPNTQRFVFIAAGLGRFGSDIAGEFLTDPKCIAELTKSLPKGWPSKNLEIVLTTQVIDGKPGPPRVQAIEIW